MKLLRALLPVLIYSLLYPVVANAQGGAELSLKARVSGFQGRFGETYSAIGYEPALTIKPNARPLAFGLSYSQNLLNYNASSDMEAILNLVTIHTGVKGTVATHFHPFAYALVGMRFMSYKNEDAPADTDPQFTSFSLGLGGRAGLQIGTGNWRFETTIEYLTGTNSRYLTPDAFTKAAEQGRDVRDFTNRSLITAITVGAGVTYVLNWNNVLLN